MVHACMDLIQEVLSPHGPAPHPETWELGTVLHYTWGPLETASKCAKTWRPGPWANHEKDPCLQSELKGGEQPPISLRPQARMGSICTNVFQQSFDLDSQIPSFLEGKVVAGPTETQLHHLPRIVTGLGVIGLFCNLAEAKKSTCTFKGTSRKVAIIMDSGILTQCRRPNRDPCGT